VAAADVGDPAARAELGLDAVKGRDPRRGQVRVVAGAEEPLAPVEDVLVVLVPADARARPEGLGDCGLVPRRAGHELEGAGQEGRAVLDREGHGLLRGQAVAPAGRVVLDVAAGRVGGEPLAHVALRGVRALGEVGGRGRAAIGQRLVEPEPVADDDHRGAEHRAEVADGAMDEVHEPVVVDGWSLGAHRDAPFVADLSMRRG